MLWMSLALAGPPPVGSPYPSPFFHHGAIRVAKSVEAEYPAVPEEEQWLRHRCLTWAEIGPDGRPKQVTVVPEFAGEGCTAPFQAAAVAAVQQWRWKPKKVGKDKATVQTSLVVTFLAQPTKPVIDTSKAGSPPPKRVKQPKRPQE